MKVHNFSAGPGILPEEVLQEAAEACINFDNMNLSLLEISHRSKNFEKVMEEARHLVLEHFEVSADEYDVIYLGGGASLQFAMVPYNFLKTKAGYINTGVWASKAIKEAQKLGEVKIVASSEDKKFGYIPKNFEVPNDLDYLHITSNNTIYGTQYKSFPQVDVPLVCDMSSDIFSRKVDARQFSLIYAGAQKNMGPAGATMVMIRKDFLEKNKPNLLTMLDYKTHVKAGSMFNTPPVFPVYVVMLTLRWLKKIGGVSAIEKINEEKAKLLYAEIDRNSMFEGTVINKEDRSNMNVCFRLKNEILEPEFDKLWKEANISGIRGHRDVGGYRASLYNALSIESVKVLIEVMQEFEKKFA
ncbi:MAG: 3-phosphoserine/phosphohydroxythreonine transaminase [Bacteroidetes bacterium]|nr:MAG: 3-phosphoserine/phosphohydroxythreonine transaminase [Bacteroidota bacterium]